MTFPCESYWVLPLLWCNVDISKESCRLLIYRSISYWICFETVRFEQYGRHFADGIFKWILIKDKWFEFRLSLLIDGKILLLSRPFLSGKQTQKHPIKQWWHSSPTFTRMYYNACISTTAMVHQTHFEDPLLFWPGPNVFCNCSMTL